jgi:hypothetical protein
MSSQAVISKKDTTLPHEREFNILGISIVMYEFFPLQHQCLEEHKEQPVHFSVLEGISNMFVLLKSVTTCFRTGEEEREYCDF